MQRPEAAHAACRRMWSGRRASKLVSTIASCFTGNYVRLWPQLMRGRPLRDTPVFDGRAVVYPSLGVLRDYLAWRQADTHINNQVRAGGGGSGRAAFCCAACLTRPCTSSRCRATAHAARQYNTCYWCLVKSGKTPREAQDILKVRRQSLGRATQQCRVHCTAHGAVICRSALQGTDTAFKNELLFSQFGINYAQLPEQFRKVRAARRAKAWLAAHASRMCMQLTSCRCCAWPLQGSLVLKQSVPTVVKTREDGTPVERIKPVETVLYRDIIQHEFWDEYSHVLAPM